MNRNNNNSQMPPNQQQQNVPDHRLQEMQERLRQLELQNTQLRTTVDYMRQGPQGAAQPPANPIFKPEVEEAIKQVVNQRLQPMEQQYRQQIGFLADQLDEAKFNLNYSNDKFKPYHDKVKQIHQQAIAENRYITREDALKMVYFEETGKKNVEPTPQVQEPQQPKFDPFFGTTVDPTTGKPIMPDNSGFAPQEEQIMQQGQQPMHNMQAQQPMQWQQQQQQPQQQWQQQQVAPGAQAPMSQHPHGNAYGQFQLPNQGMNPQSAPQHQQNSARGPLGLDSSDADLQAFENNFGDIPL
jgi:hypothetical protein